MINLEYQLIAPINSQYSAIEQILTNRGIKLENIPRYLNITEQEIFPTTLIDNIDQAAKMIVKHLGTGRIYVQVDSDCDGYTSAAVLLNYLHTWGSSIVDSKITYGFHPGKQHGINLDFVPEGTTLVIAPDSSSNDYEIHKTLFDRGIDVLVIDHHEAEKISEYACVVNNQLCNYPTKTLSGVGMVYKVCKHMDMLLNMNHADDYLDLVSLGLIADMMDQRDLETFYYIKEGLRRVRNPFMKSMIEKNHYQLGDDLTPIGIAFYVAPYVNAITRVGQEEEKRTLFEAMLEWKAYESIPSTKRGCKGQLETRVEQAVRDCTNVKNRQTRSKDQNLETIETIIEDQNLLDHKLLVVKLESALFDKNLNGLIANTLATKYQRPTMILVKREENDSIVWEGSARGFEASKLTDFRGFVRDSGYAYLAEGHANAFGAGFNNDQLQEFINYADTVLYNMDFTPCYKVDFIYSAQSLKSKDILDIGEMKSLWGQNVGEAKIAVEGIQVTADRLTLMSRDKNPTLKITLPNGVACIKFKSSEEEFDELYSDSGCVVINIVGTCSINEFCGMITPQIFIENYDIVKRQNYYF